jgi:hypothetical protein
MITFLLGFAVAIVASWALLPPLHQSLNPDHAAVDHDGL